MSAPIYPHDPTLETHDWRFCPECGLELEHCNGNGSVPPYLYCPICRDVAYDANNGEKTGRLV